MEDVRHNVSTIRILFLKAVFFLGLLTLSLTAFTQNLDSLANVYAKRHFDTLRALLRLPNDAHDLHQIAENVSWSRRAFSRRGFQVHDLKTEGPPLLLAERRSMQKNIKTVLIYLQLDGQPVDPQFWYQESPYEPVLKGRMPDGGWEVLPWDTLGDKVDPEWRIFARSSADAKGPVSMFLAAIDAMDDTGQEIGFHMKVIMDFEEELGSPHLPDAVVRNTNLLSADMLVILDGPRHVSNRPTLTFGARGMSSITLTVYGPTFPQHSGHYGNYVPNPAVRLAELIAGMKDRNGRVVLPGFYDGVHIDEETKVILEAVPDDERALALHLGIAEPDSVATSYQESLQYPSLNIRGMSSGWVGEQRRTIVPATAIAEIDIRLVPEVDADRLIGIVRSYLEEQGYLVLDRKPTGRERAIHPRICRFESNTSYQAFRTDFQSTAGLWLTRALVRAFGEEPVKLRTMGGSIPISPFVTSLGIPAVVVPTVNPDNNQHSPNENLRVGNYMDGIKTMVAILSEPVE